MKKALIGTLLLAALILPVAAMGASTIPTPKTDYSLEQLFTAIQSAVLTILAIFVFIAFIWAAFIFLTAGGSAEKIATARTAFIWGVIGTVVGLLAWAMMSIIAKLMT